MTSNQATSSPETDQTPTALSEVGIWALRRERRLADALHVRPRLIDLFSGAGGMSAGFTRFEGHVFSPAWANEADGAAAASYEANFQHMSLGDVVAMLKSGVHIPKAEVVIGGPPCQGFSLLNRDKDGDPRRHLWRPFLAIAQRARAKIWVMENVPQLLGTPEHDDILAEAKRLGYQTKSEVLCAADYGVPQTRRRAIIVGAKHCDPAEAFPPLRTHREPPKGANQCALWDDDPRYVDNPDPWITVRDAIADLGEPVGVERRDEPPPQDLHFGRQPRAKSQLRYSLIPIPGGDRRDLPQDPDIIPPCWMNRQGGTDVFGRLWWDRPAVTIRTEFFKPEKGRYLHPDQDRPITHREAARLQGIPDDFAFVGTKLEIARQIGNAVPPPMAARIADSVLSLLLAHA